MSGQQRIQYIRVAAETGILQTFDRIIKSDHAAAGREIEDTQCPRYSEALAPCNIHAVTIVDEQEFSSYSNRKLDRSSFTIVQVQ